MPLNPGILVFPSTKFKVISSVWANFKIWSIASNFARCNHCNDDGKFKTSAREKSISTSKVSNHLKRNHKDLVKENLETMLTKRLEDDINKINTLTTTSKDTIKINIVTDYFKIKQEAENFLAFVIHCSRITALPSDYRNFQA